MFRTFEPVPPTVATEDTAVALVAAGRTGQFRARDLREILRSAGMAPSDRWVRKAIAQLAKDGLVRRTARDRFAWWAITAQGEAWAAKVRTGPALSSWGLGRTRGRTPHTSRGRIPFAGLHARQAGSSSPRRSSLVCEAVPCFVH